MSNANPEAKSSSLDIVKWLVVILLVAAGVAGNMYFANESLLYRVLGLLAIGLLALYVYVQTVQGAALWDLIKESRKEIRKVVWPTRNETTQTTLIVVVFVVITALLLWGMDTFFGWLASMVIG